MNKGTTKTLKLRKRASLFRCLSDRAWLGYRAALYNGAIVYRRTLRPGERVRLLPASFQVAS